MRFAETDSNFDLGILGDELTRAGYGEFVSCFNPLEPRPARWRKHRQGTPERLRPLIDLFMLCESVDLQRLPVEIRDHLPSLLSAGLLVESAGGGVSADGLVILKLFGNWLICQPPQVNPLFYFGGDSVALLCRLAPPTAGNCLDLCAGTGIHALHYARFENLVTAVELEPQAAQLAGLNVGINRLDHRIEVLQGDLFGPVRGRRFDAIAANPPLLPLPEELSPPRVGHGGVDGLETVWRILDALPEVLQQKGRLQAIATTLSDGEHLLARHRLEQVAKKRELRILVSTLTHTRLLPQSGFFRLLIEAVAHISEADEATVSQAYIRLLEATGATHLCHLFIEGALGVGELELIDMSPTGGGLWHV